MKKNKPLNKKGVFDNVADLFKMVAVVAVMAVVAFLVMSQAKTQIGTNEGIDTANATQCATSYACNATTDMQDAAAGLPAWLPIIIIVIIGGLLIGLVSRFSKGR